jgi:hypothetical protein
MVRERRYIWELTIVIASRASQLQTAFTPERSRVGSDGDGSSKAHKLKIQGKPLKVETTNR